MKKPNEIDPIFKANIISVTAAVIIEILLLTVYISNSLSIVFEYPFNSMTVFLIILGIWAYHYYIKGLNISKNIMKYISPLSLALASASLIYYVATLNPVGSALFIFSAYFVEAIVGIYLQKDLSIIDNKSAKLFIIGMSIFIFTLPLTILSINFVLVPIFGNVMKAGGLMNTALQIYDNNFDKIVDSN